MQPLFQRPSALFLGGKNRTALVRVHSKMRPSHVALVS